MINFILLFSQSFINFFGQNRFFIVFWEYSENQFNLFDLKKGRQNFRKTAPPSRKLSIRTDRKEASEFFQRSGEQSAHFEQF